MHKNNEPCKDNYTISYASWYTERKIVTNGNEFPVDIVSAQNTNIPKILIAAHQSQARIGTSSKANHIAIFDHVDEKNIFVN